MLVPSKVGYPNFPYVIIESILFGIAIPLTFLCITLLWKRWRGTLPQWITLSYTIIIFGLAAGNLACFGIYTFGHSNVGVVWGHALSYEMSLWLSDSFLLYRAFVIYRGQRKWLILPGIAICASMIYSFIGLAHQTNPSPARGLVFVPAVISLALDVILTIMIAGRFLVYRKRACKMASKFGKPYATLVLIFVESGALSTLAKLTAIINFAYAGAFIVPFCSIAPSLIAIRVALDLDFKAYRSTVKPRAADAPSAPADEAGGFESEIGNVVGGAEMRDEDPCNGRRITFPQASLDSF